MDPLNQSLPAEGSAGAGVYFRHLPWVHDNPSAFWFREIQGKRIPHVVREKVSITGWSFDMLGTFAGQIEASESFEGQKKTCILRHGPDFFTLVELVDGWAEIITAGRDRLAVEKQAAAIAKQVTQDDGGSVVPITFWALDPEKWPRAIMRKLETPQWTELSGNYDTAVTEGMKRLFSLKSCPKERLILWHGPAGTGKTHALRALIREWQSWCDAAFITDAERFVGGSPTYLFEVANFSSGRTAVQAQKRCKLIILEDAGELMTMEARATTGQGLSRLLNLTDGLMGQGLNVMVLITTNEPLSSMHPAVIRPGRCLSELEFGALSQNTANRWLREKNVGHTVGEPTSLAQLYAISTGRIG
ncbi:MAG: AAA family ATPase [Gammaproteobacteria bacterium]